MSNIYIFSSYICRNVTSPNRRESSQEPPRTTFDETLSGLVKRGETLLSPYPSTVFLRLRWGTVASSALRLELNRVRKGLLKNGKIYNVRCRPAGSRPRAGRSPPTIHRGKPKKKGSGVFCQTRLCVSVCFCVYDTPEPHRFREVKTKKRYELKDINVSVNDQLQVRTHEAGSFLGT